MREKIIKKIKNIGNYLPNLPDYHSFYSKFSWEDALNEIDGLPEGKGLNIAYEAVDRHVLRGFAAKIALRFIRKNNETNSVTFQQLKDLSNQFANVLKALNVEKADRVFVLTDRTLELYITALGVWKNRNVFCPLFSALGPEPIKERLSIGSGKILITTEALYRKKITNIRSSLPELKYILIVGGENAVAGLENTLW